MVDEKITRLLSWLFPGSCRLCGASAPAAGDLCQQCRSELPVNDAACPVCALPLPGAHGAVCGHCLSAPPPYHRSLVPYLYREPFTEWIPAMKFHGDLVALRCCAELLVAALAEGSPSLAASGLHCVVPVPLHPARLRQRGYNQALELARPLARAMQLPLRHQLLRRIRKTPPQTTLPRRARLRGVRGAFAADSGVTGLSILLVDDVITTGATVAVASSTLLRAGAASVTVLALARAVPPPH